VTKLVGGDMDVLAAGVANLAVGEPAADLASQRRAGQRLLTA